MLSNIIRFSIESVLIKKQSKSNDEVSVVFSLRGLPHEFGSTDGF